MDLDIITIIVTVLVTAWTAGAGILFGWLGPKVRDFFAETSDNQFLEFGKRVAADFVDELDQYIEQGLATKENAKREAVASTVAALTAKKTPKQIKKVTGKSPETFATTLVEASVNRKRALAKAAAAEAKAIDLRPT